MDRYAGVLHWLAVAEQLDAQVDVHLLADYMEVPGVRDDVMEEENHFGYDLYDVSCDEDDDKGKQGGGDGLDDKVKLEDEPRLLTCLLYTSPSPRDGLLSRMPSSA